MPPRVLVPAFAATLALLSPLHATAQEAPPPGFAPDEVKALLAAPPFAAGALAEQPPAAGGGGEEALRNLIVNVGGPRFAGPASAGGIATGRLRRPPPDTTLWPERFGEDGLGLGDLPAGTIEAWAWAARTWAPRHEANVRVLGLLGAAMAGADAGNAGLGRTLVFAARPNTNAGPDDAARVAGFTTRALAEAIAARSGAPEPEALAAGLLDAATLGAFLPAGQRTARQRYRAAQRAGGLAAPALQPGAEVGLYEAEAAQALPWELTAAVAGAVLHLRGIGDAEARWPVTVSEEAGLGLRAPEFAATGFDLVGIAVTAYRGARPRGTFETAALLAFADGGGRRAWLSLALRFAIGEDSIVLETADAVPVAPANPAAQVFFVPDGALGEWDADDPVSVLRAIRSAAVDADSAFADPLGYTAIAVVADRLPPDAAAELRIAANADGIEGYAGVPAHHDLGGWRLLAYRATFALRSEPEFFFKVVVRPGSGRLIDDDAGPRTAGVFSTLLGAEPSNAGAGRVAPQPPGRPLARLEEPAP